MTVSSPFPDVGLPTQNLADWCLADSQEWPEQQAMVCGATGRALTFAQLTDVTK